MDVNAIAKELKAHALNESEVLSRISSIEETTKEIIHLMDAMNSQIQKGIPSDSTLRGQCREELLGMKEEIVDAIKEEIVSALAYFAVGKETVNSDELQEAISVNFSYHSGGERRGS